MMGELPVFFLLYNDQGVSPDLLPLGFSFVFPKQQLGMQLKG